MYSTAARLIFVIVLVMIVLVPQHSTSHALARVALPGNWEVGIRFCRDGFLVTGGGAATAGQVTSVSILGAQPGSETGTVMTLVGPGTIDGSKFFAWETPQEPGTPVSVTVDCSINSVSQTSGVGRMGYDFVEDCIAVPYDGPGLPPPGKRNLVLVVSDIPVLDSPAGKPTGTGLKACQTAFVVENQDSYGRIYVMGGWIDLARTVDVPENYGQPGSPIVSGCVGK